VIREFGKLGQGPFDLLVIGGGIYGSWIAYDAAQRGLKVALVERRDWASGTSSASSKLIHGGLRYLEQRRFGLVRKTLKERELLLQLGPHRVRPIRFLVPIYDDSRVSRFTLRLGLWAYDVLAGRRMRMQGHRYHSRRDLLHICPPLGEKGLKGGFSYPDCQTDDARFVVELVDGAAGLGATVVNRAAATELLVEDSAVVGARVEDTESGEAILVRAGMTANCAGPWCGELVRTARPSAPPLARLSKGVHLVMPALPGEDGLLLLTRRHGGVIFLIPWYGRTLVGTTDTDFQGDPDRLGVEPEELSYLLAEANRVLNGSPWTESDVIGAFAGLRALPVTRDSSSSAVSRELVVEEPLPNLLTPVGGKYTSARADAAGLVDQVTRRLDRGRASTLTGARPMPWAPIRRWASWSRAVTARGLELGLDEAVLDSCRKRYGTSITRVFELIEERPELAARIVPEAPFCLAEIVNAVRHEMARSLEDALRRRIPLSLVARPARVTLLQAADLMGPDLGWSDARKHEEVAALLRGPGHRAAGGRTD
jgi:glycerol-3-phosphate dehydrogenase